MCIICVDFQKGLLTVSEARQNLSEMSEISFEHWFKLEKMLLDAEEKS